MAEKYSDFEEITLAITLLAALSAFLLKLFDYFNNNIININATFLYSIRNLVFISLIEIFIILLFLILKGYLISVKNKSTNLISFTKLLFGCCFIYAIFFSIISVMMLFFFIFFGTAKENPYFIGYLILVIFISLIILVWLIKDPISENKIKISGTLNNFIILIAVILIIFIFLLLYSASTYLLMGSYSIDVFPQSNSNDDILTVTIKETGIPYNFNWITLFKLNSTSNFKQKVDAVIIYKTNETLSDNKFMLGENIYGTWYLNINTSNLQSGTYLLLAEVTDEPSSRFFGKTQKRADKLFYIAKQPEII